MKNIAQLIGEDRKWRSDVSTESSRRDSPAPQPLFLSLPRHARARAAARFPGGRRRPRAATIRLLAHPTRFPASLCRWRRMASSSSSPAPAPAGEPLRQKRILSSKLYLDVPSSKVGRGHPFSHPHLPGIARRAAFPCLNRIVSLQAPVVYSPAYDISFLGLEKL